LESPNATSVADGATIERRIRIRQPDELDLIGRGHGSAYLKLLAERLRAEGAPVVAVDPDVGNFRARRAYEKAGFRGDTVVESGEGILMIFDD
jgi:aminoglycoside 6'-N-acetyltransferase